MKTPIPDRFPQPLKPDQLDDFRAAFDEKPIEDAVFLRLELKAKMEQLKSIMAVADEILMVRIPAELGDMKASLAGLGSCRVATKWTHTIQKEILVLAGVDLDVIKRATKSNESKPFLIAEFPRAAGKEKSDDDEA